MINLKHFFDDFNQVKKLLTLRKINIDDLKMLEELYLQRKNALVELESLNHQINICTSKIKDTADLASKKSIIKSAQDLKKLLASVKNNFSIIDNNLQNLLVKIPNIPDESTYHDWDKTCEFKVIATSSHHLKKSAEVIDHFQFLKSCNLVDEINTAKMAGTKFVSYLNNGAYLLRALANFMLNTHVLSHRYQEVIPPVLVNESALIKSGHLPKFANDIYASSSNKYLIPTSEVSLVNFFAGQKIAHDDLPIKLCAFTPCFRKEAGAAGRFNHGLIRLHQFYKVELVLIQSAENSMVSLKTLVSEAEFILKLLDLPYRIILLSPSDLSHASAITYDIEVWMPSLNQYVEISSCSNCTHFQASSAKIITVDKRNKKSFVHTLNGTGVALDRLIAALVENHQLNKKNVYIPLPLRQFFNCNTLLK